MATCRRHQVRQRNVGGDVSRQHLRASGRARCSSAGGVQDRPGRQRERLDQDQPQQSLSKSHLAGRRFHIDGSRCFSMCIWWWDEAATMDYFSFCLPESRFAPLLTCRHCLCGFCHRSSGGWQEHGLHAHSSPESLQYQLDAARARGCQERRSHLVKPERWVSPEGAPMPTGTLSAGFFGARCNNLALVPLAFLDLPSGLASFRVTFRRGQALLCGSD